MELEIKEVKSGGSEILPELVFYLRLNDLEENSHSFFFELKGYLKVNNTKIAYLEEYEVKGSKIWNNAVANMNDEKNLKEKEVQSSFVLAAPLSEKALNKIEESQDQEPNNDVNLNLSLILEKIAIKQTNYESVKQLESYKEQMPEKYYRISHSDWVTHFAPNLGLGKTLTVDIKIPEEKIPQNQSFFENFEKMQFYLEKMNENLVKGEWGQVIDNAREFYEVTPLFKDEDEEKKKQIANFFKSRNGTDLGTNELMTSITKLFQYLSKFKHSRSRDAEIQDKPIPQKEDAYMAYSLSVSLFNLINKKVRENGQNN